MYETFYHLSANPFRLTPDPRFCFSHSGYEQAHAYLQYAFELGEGFILLTGRPGAGKTTLIETFLGELEARDVVTARVVVSHLETTDLLRSVAYRYELEAQGLDKATLLIRIAEFFSRQKRLGRRVLLAIDEAQGLSHTALEELRLLADLQEGANSLLQIFLVGQESLRNVMREPEMEQFQQRVIGTCRLGPMSLAETRSYVEHRLRRAGWQGDPELTGPAVLAVYRFSGGVPRHINKICTRLLLQGVLEKKHKLDKDDVVGIAMEMDDEQLSPSDIGQASVDATPAHAVVSPESQEDAALLSELAVRAETKLSDKPSVPARFTPAIATTTQSSDEPVSRREVRRPVTRQGGADNPVSPSYAYARRDVMPRGVTVDPMASRHTHGILTSRVLPGVLRVREKPALLFSAVAALTLAAGALTSYFAEDVETGQRALFVRESPAMQALPPSDRNRDMQVALAAQPDGRKAEPQQAVAADPLESARRGGDVAAAYGTAWIASAGSGPRLSSPASGAAIEASAPIEPLSVDRASDAAATSGSQNSDTGQAAGSVVTVSRPVLESDPGALRNTAGSAQQVDATAAVAADSSADGKLASVASSTALAVPAADPVNRAESARRQDAVTPVSSQKKVARLLSQGRTALSEDRLLIPTQRSAYHYFNRALALEPDNWEAQYGLDKIVDRYIELTAMAMQRGDDLKAKRYIARGLRVRSGDSRLLAMRDRIDGQPDQLQPPETLAAQIDEPGEKPGKPKNVVNWLKDFFSRNAVESRRDDTLE